MSRRLALLLTLCAVSVPAAQSSRAPQIDSITAAELRADLFFLASDAMQGRLTDTRENALAADWVASRFERIGLKPGGNAGGFDHRYNLMTASLGAGQRALDRRRRRQSCGWDLRASEEFYPHRFSANAAAEAQVTFAGFGIVSARAQARRLPGRRPRPIALVLDREPGVNDPASPSTVSSPPKWRSRIRKVLAAQEKGAVGVIFVEDVHNQPAPGNFQAQSANYWPATPPRIERYTLKAWSDRVRIPVMQISVPAAERLVAASGRTLVDLAKTAETRGGVTPVALNTSATIKANVDHHTVPDRSVVAVLEGSDPALKNEYVVVCAHFDHDGADGPRIYNGADDDGSGTVGLLEIAEAFALAAQAGQRPKPLDHLRRVELRRARPARRLGLHRRSRSSRSIVSSPCSTWT